MLVYRIVKTIYATDLSGMGAAMYGGRWNKKGNPVIYTGESKEIALLETLVHLPATFIPDLSIVSIKIPSNSILEIKAKDLPANWFDYPSPTILSEIGQQLINENKTVALKVPSCIIHSANNYILNCNHPDFKKVKITEVKKFYFDTRLKR